MAFRRMEVEDLTSSSNCVSMRGGDKIHIRGGSVQFTLLIWEHFQPRFGLALSDASADVNC